MVLLGVGIVCAFMVVLVSVAYEHYKVMEELERQKVILNRLGKELEKLNRNINLKDFFC